MAAKKSPAPAPVDTPVVLEEETSEAMPIAPPEALSEEIPPPPPDPEIARVKEALSPRPEIPTRSQRRASALGSYVIDPSGKSGELHHDGVVYKPGDKVQLDEATALRLGTLVQKPTQE